MNDLERLGILAALQKRVNERVDELRAAQAEELRTEFEDPARGTTTRTIRVKGEKVGTLSVVATKPRDKRTYYELSVVSPEMTLKWMEVPEIVAAWLTDQPQALKDYADWHLMTTGEMPPGCAYVETVELGDKGGRFKHTTLRVDADKVEEALADQLPAVAAIALGGGAHGA